MWLTKPVTVRWPIAQARAIDIGSSTPPSECQNYEAKQNNC